MTALQDFPQVETRPDEPQARDFQVAAPQRLCTAELAECTCPDFCERDHGNE